MRARRTRICPITVAVGAGVAIAACGGGQRQDAAEPRADFPVSVDTASFPSAQRLAQRTQLLIAVHNTGHRTIPDVAVTICNVTCAFPAPAGEGTSAQAFAADIGQAYTANPSRPIWIVNRAPGACGFSCQGGGQGAAVTASANTWALGPLAPGRTARFGWAVTAVHTGRHVLAWQVAAGLNGRARAVAANGSAPRGTFTVHIRSAPAQTYVNRDGQVVTTG